MARDLAVPARRGSLCVLVVLCGALGAGALAACDAEGITPICSPDGGSCETPPGDATSLQPVVDAGAG